jgi:hypothetical protein
VRSFTIGRLMILVAIAAVVAALVRINVWGVIALTMILAPAGVATRDWFRKDRAEGRWPTDAEHLTVFACLSVLTVIVLFLVTFAVISVSRYCNS